MIPRGLHVYQGFKPGFYRCVLTSCKTSYSRPKEYGDETWCMPCACTAFMEIQRSKRYTQTPMIFNHEQMMVKKSWPLLSVVFSLGLIKPRHLEIYRTSSHDHITGEQNIGRNKAEFKGRCDNGWLRISLVRTYFLGGCGIEERHPRFSWSYIHT